ncbi:MAG: hypothetical protein ACJ8FV_15040, partial [Xanthobacteraceae bacterium]
DQARRGIADAGGRLSGITIALLETRRTVPVLGLATIQFQNFCLIRATNSLFGRSNSLLTVAKFPVPLHSEFGCNALKLLLDWRPNRRIGVRICKIPYYFPCYQGIAPADWCDRDWRPSQP